MKKLRADYEEERQGHLVFKASDIAEEAVYALLSRPAQSIQCQLDGKPFVGRLITGWPFADGTARFVVKPQKVAHKAMFVQKALPPSLVVDYDGNGPMVVRFEEPAPTSTPSFDEAFKRIMRGQPIKPVKKAATPAPHLRRYQSGQWW